MPLRDHFRPPVDNVISWEEFDGMWPAVIVQQLRTQLPDGYVAAPKAHRGAHVEVDIAAYEQDDPAALFGRGDAGGGVAVATAAATWAAAPAVAVETELPDDDEYEVRVYDARRGRTLVAAIEIVSPANKDRPEARNAFVGKCAALLRKGVAVSVVDLVTTRQFNLYADLMAFVGHPDPTMTGDAPHTYAVSCRWPGRGKRAVLEAWSYPLAIGQPLPPLPLWLADRLVVSLDLEGSYEKACRDMWIT